MALNIRKHVDSLELRLRTADNLGHDLGYRGNVRRVDIVGQVVLGTSASQTRAVHAGDGEGSAARLEGGVGIGLGIGHLERATIDMERLAHLADQVHDAAIALEQLLFALNRHHRKPTGADGFKIDEEDAAELIAMRSQEAFIPAPSQSEAPVATNQIS